MKSNKLPMIFDVVNPIFLSTNHRTSAGIPVFTVQFEVVRSAAIAAMNEGDAITLAKKMGFKHPILQRTAELMNENSI